MQLFRITLPRVLSLIILLLVVGLGWLGYSVWQRFNIFLIEDRIHGTFFPVVRAIWDYEDREHHAPAQLAELVPDFLPALPTSPHVDQVDYAWDPPSGVWRLTLHSDATGPRREYCFRCDLSTTTTLDMLYSAEEHSRMVQQFHGWRVLLAPGEPIPEWVVERQRFWQP